MYYLWPLVRTVAIDLENTGINRSRDKIIQYGIYGVDEEKQIIECGSLVDAEVGTGRDPSRIPGVTYENVLNALPLRDGHLNLIYSLCHNAVVVMHHYQFDWTFILAEFQRNHRDPPIPRKIYCTLELSRSILKLEGSRSLQNLCITYDIPLELAHNAMHDAKSTFRLFITLVNMHNFDIPLGYFYDDNQMPLWQVCSQYFIPNSECAWIQNNS